MGDVQTVLTVIMIPLIALLCAYIKSVKADAKASVDDAWKAIDDIRKDATAFQVKVATDYVHVERLKDFEARVMTTLERLEKKVDRLQEGE